MLPQSEAISVMSTVEVTRRWASDLVTRECYRADVAKPIAARAVARRIGMAPGTLANIVRGRAKRLTQSAVACIQRAVVRELEAEIARLSHDLAMARACGVDSRSDEITEIETLLKRARDLLDKQL